MSVEKTNSEQVWFKSWIKTRNIKLEASVPNITNTRERILQTHNLLQDLRSKLNYLKEIRDSVNEDEWKVKIESLENVKKTLESNLSSIDQQFIEKVKLKISKIRRHKRWRVKHIKKLQSVRDERQRRRETLHKTIDEWRTEWIAKELALKRVKKLRDLRRERLKREGHFFPEEDDEFFNRIASLNDAMKVEEAPEFDLDNLVSIRRQWDAYIDETGSVGSSCIPPTFVNPSPPANYIWASCLMHGSP
ncbi:15361_t:CDS:2 [Funneliformis caledonium]|uniref:15361_t:CDS:1 n=1 Tax=Funneliformis caledonium TaxID=1117310 RepID=A0A9N9ARS8_9GLOM|nr:15361_t:CDS:2 [Funneliformis caledonium]